MKSQKFVIALSLLISTGGIAAGESHSHGKAKPMHGGVVTEVKDIEYELVAKSEFLQLYLRDHGNPIDVSKSSAKLTLLTGVDKQEVELKPSGNKLEVNGAFKITPNTKVVAIVMTGEKKIIARFVLK